MHGPRAAGGERRQDLGRCCSPKISESQTAARQHLRKTPLPRPILPTGPNRVTKMVKPSGSKLLNALQNEKGVDHKKDKQKKLQKQAEKRKQKKQEKDDSAAEEDEPAGGVAVNGAAPAESNSSGDEAGKQIRGEARKAAAQDDSEDEEDSDEEEGSKV